MFVRTCAVEKEYVNHNLLKGNIYYLDKSNTYLNNLNLNLYLLPLPGPPAPYILFLADELNWM